MYRYLPFCSFDLPQDPLEDERRRSLSRVHPGRHEYNVLSLELERATCRRGLFREQVRVYLGLTFILDELK